MTRDPAVEAWREAIDRASGDVDAVLNLLGPPSGESTSARLRRVESELGSALGALNEARHELAHAHMKISQLETRLAYAREEGRPCGWRPLAVQLMREQEEAGVELGHQRALIDELIADRARLRAEVIRVRGQEAGLP